MARSPSVLAVGDLNADLILTGLSGTPRPGREVVVRGCLLTLGGSAAIFACGLARLGRPVRFLGKVGDDEPGRLVLGLMRRRGVDVSGVRSDPKVGTGIAAAISGTGDRALVSFLGTVATATLRDLDLSRLERHRHLHLTSPFLQSSLRPHFPALLKRAKRAGLTTSIDPGWDPAESWKVEDILPWLDVLLVNELEAEALTGLKPVAAAAALARRVPLAVVKLGPHGAMAASAGRAWRAPSFPVKPLDTTGAGDTFAAGFIDSWLGGKTVEDALAFGCACGALSTLKPGGYEGQPTRAQAGALLRKGRP
jgi:sugar/nucleoside kinase (ribokinase family)